MSATERKEWGGIEQHSNLWKNKQRKSSKNTMFLTVPLIEEEETRVKECCQRTLAVRNQRAIRGRGAITKPYKCPAHMQLTLVNKIIATLQESCEQRRRVRQLERGLGGYESSSESGDDGSSDSDRSSEVPFLG